MPDSRLPPGPPPVRAAWVARSDGADGMDGVDDIDGQPRRPDDAVYHTYQSDLSQVRDLVRRQAREAGLTDARVEDLVLAVSEVAANTLRHTRSTGTLAIWHDADEVVCEVRDEGTITDPLAGRRRPPPDASGGHGLWLVRQVCDLVELTSDASGTTIRMHMARRARETAG